MNITLSHLPLTVEFFSTVESDKDGALTVPALDKDGNPRTDKDGAPVVETVDPRLVILVSKLDEVLTRREDKDSGPGVRAFATKTVKRIVGGIEKVGTPKGFPMDEVRATLSVSTSKDSVLSDLLSDLGV